MRSAASIMWSAATDILMKGTAKRVAKTVVGSSTVRHVANRLHMAPWQFVPPGHFYSPIPALDSVRRDEQRLFPSVMPHELPGIELDETRQLAMLDELQPYYDSQPFDAQKTRNLRYFFENPMYTYSDAIFLHCMIRHARPRRIIEIGSG